MAWGYKTINEDEILIKDFGDLNKTIQIYYRNKKNDIYNLSNELKIDIDSSSNIGYPRIFMQEKNDKIRIYIFCNLNRMFKNRSYEAGNLIYIFEVLNSKIAQLKCMYSDYTLELKNLGFNKNTSADTIDLGRHAFRNVIQDQKQNIFLIQSDNGIIKMDFDGNVEKFIDNPAEDSLLRYCFHTDDEYMMFMKSGIKIAIIISKKKNVVGEINLTDFKIIYGYSYDYTINRLIIRGKNDIKKIQRSYIISDKIEFDKEE